MIAIIARIWTTLIEVIPAGVFWLRHVADAEDASTAPSAPSGRSSVDE
jgi:hypothetical protein